MSHILSTISIKKLSLSVVLSISALISYIATLNIIQDKIIYQPRSYTNEYKQLLVHPYVHQFKYNTTHNGIQTSFIVINNNNTNHIKYTKLMFMYGGNAALALDWLPFINNFYMRINNQPSTTANIQYIFILMDYCGYGYNKYNYSVITPNNILECTLTAYNQVVQLYDAHDIEVSLIGHSLGSAIVLQLYEYILHNNIINNIDELILISPFTSIYDMSAAIFGVNIPLLELLLKHEYNNRQRLQFVLDHTTNNHTTISIYHGIHDEIVPIQHGRELSKLHSNINNNQYTIQYTELPCYHNDIIDYISTQLCNKLIHINSITNNVQSQL